MSERAITLDGKIPVEVAATKYGHLTVDARIAHRLATGEELEVYLNGVDVTGRCLEADDVDGYVIMLQSPVHLNAHGERAKETRHGLIEIRPREKPITDVNFRLDVIGPSAPLAEQKRGHFTAADLQAEERATGNILLVSCRDQDVTGLFLEGEDGPHGWVKLFGVAGSLHGPVSVSARAPWKLW